MSLKNDNKMIVNSLMEVPAECEPINRLRVTGCDSTLRYWMTQC